MDELEQQTREVLEGKPPTTNIFPFQVSLLPPHTMGWHFLMIVCQVYCEHASNMQSQHWWSQFACTSMLLQALLSGCNSDLDLAHHAHACRCSSAAVLLL